MQHNRNDRDSLAAGPRQRQHQRLGDRAPGALSPAAIALSLTLMGCSNLMQTGSGAAPQGRLTVEVADAALAAGAPDVALRVAELILRDAPRNVPALVAKGDANYEMGHLDLARGAYRSAVTIDPASVPGLIGLGRTLVRSNPKAAEAAFLDAATREPDNATALSNLGIARDLQGRHEAAQTAYRQALAVAPGATDVTINLGLSLALSGKPGEAVALLRPLAQEADATGVRRNDLAAALALAGDRIESQRLLGGDLQPAGADAGPADTASVSPPLVAITAPMHGHPAPPADTGLRADLAPHADPTPSVDAAPRGDATLRANPSPLANLSSPTSQTQPAGLPLPTDVSPHADATPRAELATHNDVVRAADPPPRADARPHADMTPYAAAASSSAAGPTPPLDIRTAPVTPVMQMADAGTAAQLVKPMAAAPRPPQATRDVPALSRPHDHGPVKLAAARPGRPPDPMHRSVVATASRAPMRSPTDAPTAAASAPGTSTLATLAPPAPTQTAPTQTTPTQTTPTQTTLGEHKAGLFAQLAALDSEPLARVEWQHLQSRMCGLLDGRTPEIVAADVHGRTFWRLRTGGFRTATEQSAFCSRVHGLGLACW